MPSDRSWPTVPIPFSALESLIHELARAEWAESGGIPPFAVASEALLRSAVAEPYQLHGGRELYPTIPAKAACLFRGLVKNHGLVDGNKRVAVTAVSTFLLLNGRYPTYSNTELLRYALRVARWEGNFPLVRIERWIRRHSRLFEPNRHAIARAEALKLYEEGDPTERWFATERRGDT